MNNRGIGMLLAASTFHRLKVESVASPGNADAVILPLNPGFAGVDDYLGLVDKWVRFLAAASDRTAVVVAACSGPWSTFPSPATGANR